MGGVVLLVVCFASVMRDRNRLKANGKGNGYCVAKRVKLHLGVRFHLEIGRKLSDPC